MKPALLDQYCAALYASTDSDGTYIGQVAGTFWNVFDFIVGGVVAKHVTEVKPKQLPKAEPPIEITELPMVTEVKPVQL